jgi:hypothetical protein
VSPAGRPVAAALTIGLLLVLLCCQDYPHRGLDIVELEVKILKDAELVRTRQGERLIGYLAEYQEDFQAHRAFLSLEIQRYEKGERLTVKGGLSRDTVPVSYGGQPALEVPVVYVRKAAPAGSKVDVEKLVAGPEKKR